MIVSVYKHFGNDNIVFLCPYISCDLDLTMYPVIYYENNKPSYDIQKDIFIGFTKNREISYYMSITDAITAWKKFVNDYNHGEMAKTFVYPPGITNIIEYIKSLQEICLDNTKILLKIIKIQKTWLNCLYNPESKICSRYILKGFYDLEEILKSSINTDKSLIKDS